MGSLDRVDGRLQLDVLGLSVLQRTVIPVLILLVSACGHEEAPRGTSVNTWTSSRVALADYGIGQAAISDTGQLAVLATDVRTMNDQIVFVKDKQEVRPITPQSWIPASFAWLPKTDQLAVFRLPIGDPEPTALELYDANGKRARTVSLDPPLQVTSGASALSDGRTLVVSAHPVVGLGESASDLYRVDAVTGRALRLTSTESVSETNPAGIGDQAVAFTAVPDVGADGTSPPSWIGVLNLSTKAVRAVTQHDRSYAEAKVSHDGKYILYHGVPTRAYPGNDGLWAVPIAGGEPKRLIDSLPGSLAFIARDDLGVWVQGVSAQHPLGELTYHKIQLPR